MGQSRRLLDQLTDPADQGPDRHSGVSKVPEPGARPVGQRAMQTGTAISQMERIGISPTADPKLAACLFPPKGSRDQ
jgi:hypothetical protein